MNVMTTAPTPDPADDVLYPSSDGQPMAESDLHADEMTELKLMLRHHLGDRADDYYVAGNLFVYYERGNPRAVFAPDVFVVRGVPQRQRDTYKLWLDGPAPAFAMEVSSKSTRLEDRGNKMAVCEMLGVDEYFVYDPRAEYLDPPLQGYRLTEGSYHPIAAEDDGRLTSETLGLAFRLGPGGLIEVHDVASGTRLLRTEEERARAEEERRRAETERRRADEAERRLSEALAQLRTEKR